ncbi:alpha/beta hydrolase [Cecembia calidifontis]|uniref:Acetyl esterase/lipase n=1 Tax=Cecembia calidifontis TaxID=1187080 RepID=A0A4Q7P5I2_9BACT|nr:alpha/beta hydrolase [Cecembia calidifontis]RZS95185.1 acetyl esterase/lipase [Cecembia calidifontis]
MMKQGFGLQYFSKTIFLLGFIFIFSCGEDKVDNPIPDPRIPLELIDLSYGTDSRQKMDVYLPANRTRQNTKVLIWIHGGAWIDGDKAEFRDFKPWFEAVQQDYAYISLNYRLFNAITGANPFPSQEEDIERAMDFIRSKLQEWNVSEKVVLAGGSAGGHLSLLHSYKNNDGLVKVAVGIFPPTDLLTLGNGNPLIEFLLRNLIGDPIIDRVRYVNGSPVNFIQPNAVPTAFFHGDRDDIVPIAQSYLLEERLRENGVPKAFKYYPGLGHGFTEPIYREIIQITENFIRQHL